MASSKKSSKTTKTKKQHTPDYYPVQRKVPLGVFDSSISATTVGDAGRLLSITNRRLMRYGMNYQIKIDLEPNAGNATPFSVDVFALTNNWDVQRAFALAKHTWDEAHSDELKAASGATPARWLDFRVAHDVSGAADLQPVRYDQSTLAAIVTDDGEHVDSTVDDNGSEKRFSWSTSSASALNVLAEWGVAGRTSNDPSSFSTSAPYDGVNEDNSDIEMANLGGDGNAPPYSVTSKSDLFTKVATLRYQPGAEGLQRLSTGFFDAPCGLFVLKHNLGGANLSNGTISMVAKSGDYKGVDAKAMSN